MSTSFSPSSSLLIHVESDNIVAPPSPFAFESQMQSVASTSNETADLCGLPPEAGINSSSPLCSSSSSIAESMRVDHQLARSIAPPVDDGIAATPSSTFPLSTGRRGKRVRSSSSSSHPMKAHQSSVNRVSHIRSDSLLFHLQTLALQSHSWHFVFCLNQSGCSGKPQM